MGADEDTHLTFRSTNDDDKKLISAKELLANPDPNSSVLKRVVMVVVAMFVDIGVPLAIYFILRIFLVPLWAMMISGIPALAICIIKTIITRQLSVMALIIFCGFVSSASVSLATNDPRILLLQSSLMMGAIGFLHLASLLPVSLISVKVDKKASCSNCISIKVGDKVKPFLYYNLNQMFPLGDMNPEYTNGEVISKYNWLWNNIRIYRIHLRVVTAETGIMLSGEFIIKICMIFSSLSVDDVMLYSNILFALMMGFMIVFSGIYIVLAKNSFYKHVDKWIAENYGSNQSKDLKEYKNNNSPATYLLFSATQTDSQDSA